MMEEEPDPFMDTDDEPASGSMDDSDEMAEEDDAAEEASGSSGSNAAKEPDFPEGASVSDAIAAVPQGAERLNIDHETLAKPLQDPEVYAPCKPGSQKFSVKVAVWNGRAVGVDVKANNPTLAKCLDEQVRQVEWNDKVPSLNTIEVGF